jgi:hypothetical protein
MLNSQGRLRLQPRVLSWMGKHKVSGQREERSHPNHHNVSNAWIWVPAFAGITSSVAFKQLTRHCLTRTDVT